MFTYNSFITIYVRKMFIDSNGYYLLLFNHSNIFLLAGSPTKSFPVLLNVMLKVVVLIPSSYSNVHVRTFSEVLATQNKSAK